MKDGSKNPWQVAGGCGRVKANNEKPARSCGPVAECPSRETVEGAGSYGTMTMYGRVIGRCGRTC